MGQINNSQSFSSAASGVLDFSYLAPIFKTNMDAILLGGRDITVNLPPTKSECTDVDCSYNSFYKKYIGTNGQVCQTCRGQGFIVEPRWTIYRANIRWTDEPFNFEGGRTPRENEELPGRIGANFARTKTVYESMDHIKDSNGAVIDTFHVELFEEPRYVGFGGNLYYVVTYWKKVNR